MALCVQECQQSRKISSSLIQQTQPALWHSATHTTALIMPLSALWASLPCFLHMQHFLPPQLWPDGPGGKVIIDNQQSQPLVSLIRLCSSRSDL